MHLEDGDELDHVDDVHPLINQGWANYAINTF